MFTFQQYFQHQFNTVRRKLGTHVFLYTLTQILNSICEMQNRNFLYTRLHSIRKLLQTEFQIWVQVFKKYANVISIPFL